ncbi:c-type cytochrome biogenesis protein CcsB [Candidatus Thiothrix anitrata]|jgi:cytochrome c-type biogenesis protein CcsB|uniref:C-type cytochrome biogenesis protein CcsB n=1 Tax=Candidatus Thiothrix anitrata TaxID=2823902 RepID=A0ABX7X3K8_9GAMM|nr:c-type cytochrome biogenesis protein CcsB [Candidatus Thiothrix anitrata]QTR50482.1 c-type cytochrome biogenesis protein CcsB [Candidatus Thiothrix anitrata]
MSVQQESIDSLIEQPGLFKQLKLSDWLWALVVIAGTAYALMHYHVNMDVYEVGILAMTAPAIIAQGWYWKAFQPYSIAVALLSLLGIWLYDGNYASAESVFGLKYLVSSQSAVMWMSALFVMATVTYFAGLFTNNTFTLKTASAMTWVALVMGLVGLMVRWYESYLIDPEFGHIPVSNLYEVFILFCLITGLMYLYYEGRHNNRSLGGFVLLVISAAVAFLLWYSFDREAHKILPLVPALKSYWMKIHVPANFVGYGAFAIAAMVSIAYLIKERGMRLKPQGFAATRLPSLEMMDEINYKAIALGFAFFTIATILGAMWAAEAWGGYWSWDPKETWALIVWLNYAAWLHLRFSKGWRGVPMAWWAIVGLFITLFAFLGVNMFLSGLHSYGEL